MVTHGADNLSANLHIATNTLTRPQAVRSCHFGWCQLGYSLRAGAVGDDGEVHVVEEQVQSPECTQIESAKWMMHPPRIPFDRSVPTSAYAAAPCLCTPNPSLTLCSFKPANPGPHPLEKTPGMKSGMAYDVC